MKPFLQTLAEKLFYKHGAKLQEVTVIFPNRRAGLFFRKYLSQLIDRPIWAPEILSIEDCMKGLTKYQLADKLTLVFELYEEYKNIAPKKESFDRFYFWGEMLLKDFDDIDKYLVNPKDLFTNLKEEKDIENLFDYLSEDQVEFIRSFWKSFRTSRQSEHQEGFLKIWEILFSLYERFKSRLNDKSLAYEGMIFREVYRKIEDGELTNKYGQLVFAGFNALTASEEKIFTWFKGKQGAEIYWDADAYYMEDKVQEAGVFLRSYFQPGHPLQDTFETPFPKSFGDKDYRNIEITGVPLEVGQSKKLGEKLRELVLDKGAAFDPEKTVIVLPEEQNLFPVLHSMPKEVELLNVTMGYPLRNTPMYTLVENLLDLQEQAKVNADGKVRYHYRNVMALFRHPYIRYYNVEKAAKLLVKIEKENLQYIGEDTLKEGEALFQGIFKKVNSVKEIFDYLLDVLVLINSTFNERQETKAGKGETVGQLLEQEYVYHFYTQLNRLKDNVVGQNIQLKQHTFVKLFRQIIQSLRLPFSGEPLKGLQIMGVLETRNLDFENVFILSMNEGAYPAKASTNSFVPFNLRKGYGLPTLDHSDAIYAYSFYRLLQRAKNVHLFYNTEEGLNSSGEMSRFLQQIIYESGLKINRKVLSNPVQPASLETISMEKDEKVLIELGRYLRNGETRGKSLTASAINTYLDCQLKFYFRYVAKLYEAGEVAEEIDAMTFGNLLHSTMENLYTEFMARYNTFRVQPQDFEILKEMLDQAVDKSFVEHFSLEEGEKVELGGRDIIARRILLKFGKRILKEDKAYAPFNIIGLETDGKDSGFYLDFDISYLGKKERVALKGIIDRIDRKEEQVRVIDYKTGRDDKILEDIPSLFDPKNKKRNKAAMQVLLYGLLYKNKFPEDNSQIMTGLFNARELFGENFDIRLKIKEDRRRYKPINDVSPLLEEYQEELRRVLEEIYDPQMPFNQTDDVEKCSYCAYAGICHR
ncbi:PD-(D/E)XK nuclease family protein [Xanthovirga aplysinae]|uniref:PD-(D/E)XK nuclease family protein n=1 Tax=Xanthovirga aplysinae TaxID=2529853 RepID=UPI0012BC030F|nr:PD-(D/E)XK nuclease family protein [Xanthovirga aplysinae]MTI33401.1 PD-(D/E)XK nuclease family protein [Xanthovirga aplysinae]